MPATARVLRFICIGIGVAFTALWIVAAYYRLAYPYEVEWMEGSMVDHALRILDGKPIYTAPSIDFVAWLYPPLYYYVVAAVMKCTGVGFFAGRIVSVISTLLTAGMLGVITQRITGKWVFAYLTMALYFATYHVTGFYFDIVRNDAFFTALLVATALVAHFHIVQTAPQPEKRSLKTAAIGIITRILLALAIATKQQAIFFIPGLAIWFWLRDRRVAILFLVTVAGSTIIGFLVANAFTDGWFSYYLLRIPQAKRADFVWLRMLDVFPNFALGPFAVSSLAIVALIVTTGHKQKYLWAGPVGLLGLLAISALISGAVSIGNEGGYANVMMPFAAFIVPLLPIAVNAVSGLSGTGHGSPVTFAYFAMLFQFIALFFNPLSEKMLIPGVNQRRGGDEFFRELQAIPGDVLIPYHGYISRQAAKQTHAHVLASLDVLRVHDTTAIRLQADLDSAFAKHQFSAVILEESPLFSRDSVAHYTFVRRMIAEPNVYLTRVRDEATRPEYLFLPK